MDSLVDLWFGIICGGPLFAFFAWVAGGRRRRFDEKDSLGMWLASAGAVWLAAVGPIVGFVAAVLLTVLKSHLQGS